jgi:hypothetical protein
VLSQVLVQIFHLKSFVEITILYFPSLSIFFEIIFADTNSFTAKTLAG